MTQDEIIKMAKQAGLFTHKEVQLEIVAFANLVTEKEREACAKICEKHADTYEALEKNQFADVAWSACIDICDAIRARGQA
jgi:glutamate formiminotransferase